VRNEIRSLHPPPFQSTIQFTKIYRFVASAALANEVVAISDLMDLVIVATSATTAVNLASAIKLAKVDIWGPMAQDLKPVTCSIEFPAVGTPGLGGPQRIWSDTSMGSSTAAYVSKRPPDRSPQAFWQGTYSNDVFIILNGPIGSVVDISMTSVVQNGESPQSPTAAVVGATPGQVYVRALDSLNNGLLVPQSYPTI